MITPEAQAQGERIRQARLNHPAGSLTQAQLVVLLGLPPSSAASISRWERGIVLPTPAAAVAIERVLGVKCALTRSRGGSRGSVVARGLEVRSDLGRKLLVVGLDSRTGELVVASRERFASACKAFDRHCKGRAEAPAARPRRRG